MFTSSLFITIAIGILYVIRACVSLLSKAYECRAVLVLVSSLHCYQCDSKNHPDCKEWFDFEHEDTITIRSEECKVDAAEYCIKTTGVWGG